MLPVAISGRNGFIQAYILPGETPMLMGRPIMEAIGLVLDCKKRMVKIGSVLGRNYRRPKR